MNCPTCGYTNPAGAAACVSCGTPLPLPTAPAHMLPPGTKLKGGAFTVGKVLGQGGFGITYLGSDTRQAQPVAVKELFPAGSTRHGRDVYPSTDWSETTFAEARTRFRQEGETLRRFHHPNIVDVFDVFEENRTAYLVMEYLRGRDLDVLLAERAGPLPEREAVDYIRQVAQALAVVHGAGLLHRDLKPGNIIADTDGKAVLVDFGTAREFAAEKTHRMTTMLTPGYAPLEQYSQHARFGAFTDIYALSATLYHLLTGQLPVAALDRIQGVELPSPRKLNPAVSERTDAAVMRGLAMKVDERPQTAQAFLALLPPDPAGRAPAPAAASSPVLPGTGRRVAVSPEAPRRAPSPPTPTPSPPTPAPRSLRPAALAILTGHQHWVHSVAISPTGNLAASVGQDNICILWDVNRADELRTLGAGTGPLLGLMGALYAVAFSPDGKMLATGGNDDITRLWSVGNGKLLRELPGQSGNVNALAFSRKERLLAAGCQFYRMELWDPVDGELLGQLSGPLGSVVAAAFSADGELLAGGGEDGSVFLWEAGSWQGAAAPMGHAAGVRSVAFSPDNRYLATGGDDTTVRLWDRRSGRGDLELGHHGGGVRSVVFSPEGRLLASGGDDMTVGLWSVPDGELLAVLSEHTASVTSLAFSPDGATLASGSMDGTVRLWSLYAGRH